MGLEKQRFTCFVSYEQLGGVEMNSGSRWHRWEPHVHAPGTVLNDQFKGPDPWEAYLTSLESATPVIRAIGVTDYYQTNTYERVCEAKKEGRLPKCDLIFPNVEMRLALGTVKGKWVNIHLLVSPEDPDHLTELSRLLARLSFDAHEDSFSCSRDELVRLGKRSEPSVKDDHAALMHGSEQFKVSFKQLKQVWRDSAWAKENTLIAVAGSQTDGTSGVRDGADATLRQEVEKFAHVIFASSTAQREFWLGQKAASEDELKERFGGLKPCMHGSDAHDPGRVGSPDGDRYSWIKGAVHFDTLRQACIDPAGRAFVGDESPAIATPSLIIKEIEIKGTSWAQVPRLALNPGLVTIIGARGSGKTALADMIALACDAVSDRLSSASFLKRAEDLLHGGSVSLTWQNGETVTRSLDLSDDRSMGEYSSARYLSQQFVEELCSAQGVTDALMQEIERVIFEAHALADRDGAVDFQDLLDLRATRHRESRSREERTLFDLSEQVSAELEKKQLIEGLKKQIQEKTKQVESYTKERSKLVSKGSGARVERLNALTAAADKVRSQLRSIHAQEQSLLALEDEVRSFRRFQAPEALRKAKEKHRLSGLKSEDDWAPFLLDYTGDVDATIAAHLVKAQKAGKDLKGAAPTPADDDQQPLIPADANLDELPLALLDAEIARLEKLVSIDKNTARRFSAVSKRLAEESTTLKGLKEKLADCEGAKERARALVADRESAYVRVFESTLAEQDVLTSLYEPLMARLQAAEGTLSKLSFSVSREADVAGWADEGESLLDLRQKGSFKGRGSLRQYAEASLKSAWETGSAEAVSEAMQQFRSRHESELLEHSPVLKRNRQDYRAWAKKFAKWLYGTNHISIHYSIDYDGTDIRKLSPGTRGIVLLLLYLALDDADDRPLIIDQPEESLDPKSVYDELVGLFLAAKSKRQVIMVTHNANLVVNTDADQIVVAHAGTHPPGELPPISYHSGGLEDADIRTTVCDILEGGAEAFKERARRLRVRLER